MMKTFTKLGILTAVVLLVSAVGAHSAAAFLQSRQAPLVGGLTSDGSANSALLVDANGTVYTHSTPAMTGYTTQATFNSTGAFVLTSTSTNTQTSTTTLLQTMILTNKSGSAVVCQVTDGNDRYLLGPNYSLAANGVPYVLALPTGVLMSGGIKMSCNTAGQVTVQLWGLQ